MGRVLLITLAVTVDHLEGEDLETARDGAIFDEEYPENEYPAGEDSDLDETSPAEIADIIADYLLQSNDEMWAGARREYHDRDMRLVERGDEVLALWDGDPRSGTGMTIRMAGGKPVHNVWGGWHAGQ